MNTLVDFAKQTASILVSIGIVAPFWFFVQEWLKRYLDSRFRSKDAHRSLGLEEEAIIKRQRPTALMEIAQVIYRIRNCARQIVANNTPYVLEKQMLVESVSVLTEHLYRYRLLLHDDLFDMVHTFKRASQDFALYLDVSDRPENATAGAVRFNETFGNKLQALLVAMDSLYPKITEKCQSIYHL